MLANRLYSQVISPGYLLRRGNPIRQDDCSHFRDFYLNSNVDCGSAREHLSIGAERRHSSSPRARRERFAFM